MGRSILLLKVCADKHSLIRHDESLSFSLPSEWVNGNLASLALSI